MKTIPKLVMVLVALAGHPATAEETKPMKPPACSLDEKDLEERKLKILHVLRDKATAIVRTDTGLRFTVPRSAENFGLVSTVISLETECCPFFSFSLDAKAGAKDFTFTIDAPAEAKPFLDGLFPKKP